MLVSQLKPSDELLEYTKDDREVFLISCFGCAEAFGSGGTRGLKKVTKILEDAGKRVTGTCMMDFCCEKTLVELWLRRKNAFVKEADSIMVLSCGIGAQVVASLTQSKVRPACNTVSLGGRVGQPWGPEQCDECGDCVLKYTGEICPMTRCAKGLLNGPCGGSEKGNCEVFPERECAWVMIYERLEKMGRIQEFIPKPLVKRFQKAAPPKEIRDALLQVHQPEKEVLP